MAGDPGTALEAMGLSTGAQEAASPAAFDAVRAATGRELTGELRSMYEVWNGGSLNKVTIYDMADVANVNPELREELPFAMFFGDDGGDGSFFVDLDGAIGTAGAVYWTERGHLVPVDSVPVGDTLTEFLQAVGRGEERWNGRSIREQGVDDMQKALAARPDRWISPNRPSPSDVAEVLFRISGVPAELPILLRAAGTPRFPGVGVTILPLNELVPVEGARRTTGNPGAWWFAQSDDGTRYGITARGWRDPDGGRVLRVAPGQDPATAPIVGAMPRLVIDWLEGRKR